MTFLSLCEELTNQIKDSYEQGTTLEEAEKLAGKFLYAQIQVSEELKKSDLDSRMRKSGLKSLRSAIYIDAVSKSEKKPTEAALEAMITSDDVVIGSQNAFDTAEANRDSLERYYNIFREAHIHFRSIAKGSFGG